MNHQQFDDLSRGSAIGVSRRQVITGWLESHLLGCFHGLDPTPKAIATRLLTQRPWPRPLRRQCSIIKSICPWSQRAVPPLRPVAVASIALPIKRVCVSGAQRATFGAARSQAPATSSSARPAQTVRTWARVTSAIRRTVAAAPILPPNCPVALRRASRLRAHQSAPVGRIAAQKGNSAWTVCVLPVRSHVPVAGRAWRAILMPQASQLAATVPPLALLLRSAGQVSHDIGYQKLARYLINQGFVVAEEPQALALSDNGALL